jgi:hypothetical protein
MNIKPLDYFSIKSFLGEKIKSTSLKFGRNTKKNFLKKKFFSKSPITKNILPKINRLNSLIETKGLSTDKKFISYFNKEKTENTNSYIINTNKKIYTIPFGNSLTHILNEEKKKFINTRNNDKNPSYSTTFINNINNQNENRIIDNTDNKAKKLRKIINLYYTKNHLDNKKENKNENVFEEKENKDINNKNKNKKRKSMFMTEMNFLINNDNNRKRSKIKKTKEIKHNKENEFKNNNYDSINFKELLKHIERDKKKIINNQNDIDNMLKTTKDTFYEIWKYNHH